MKLCIGENIKRLRKERDITQEEFSEILGVSCQSVSRWENNSCYPDIELIPVIADFFGITTDALMGIDNAAEKHAVDQYEAAFQEAISRGAVEECISISRKAVAEYPNNYVLLNQLMYALFISGDDSADIPDWKENMEKYDGEIMALGERIIKYCTDTGIRLEATARLAFQHCEMGRRETGRALYETMPSMTVCREQAIWWALSDEEKIPHLHKNIREAYNLLDGFIWRLEKQLPAEEALKVLEKEFAIRDIMLDGKTYVDSWGNAEMNLSCAKYLARLNRTEEALKHLSISAEAAIAFDNRPEGIHRESLLMGKRTEKRTDYETADSRPLHIILRDSWMADEAFDEIRDSEEFAEIIKMLEE